jgi:hypothetical protein
MIWIESHTLENGTQVYSCEADGTISYASVGYPPLDEYLASLEATEPEAE